MKYLLDTHVLLWAAYSPTKISEAGVKLLNKPDNTLLYSAASIWEIGIKSMLGRDDFRVDLAELLRALKIHQYLELPINSNHAIKQTLLPPLHKDPFDRILIAQAIHEDVVLLTADAQVLRYDGPIQSISV